MDSFTLSLCCEYLETCDAMASGLYDADAHHELSIQRAVIHEQLIDLLGASYARPFDMKAFARQVVAGELARGA